MIKQINPPRVPVIGRGPDSGRADIGAGKQILKNNLLFRVVLLDHPGRIRIRATRLVNRIAQIHLVMQNDVNQALAIEKYHTIACFLVLCKGIQGKLFPTCFKKEIKI